MARGYRRNSRDPSDPLASIVGECAAMREVRAQIAKIAPTDLDPLLSGLTGTGKELAARAIHVLSGRDGLHALNCSALPASLLESELFGHARGSFSGAIRDRRGIFEAANGGTLFLDEIGAMAPELQVKLLRAIEEREVRRVGEDRIRRVRFRLICATNRDLRKEVATGRFSADLYWRIRHAEIRLPPLRDRGGDVLLLARHFAGGRTISRDAAALLEAHTWPGNVRELKHAIEHALQLGTAPEIRPEDLPPDIRSYPTTGQAPAPGESKNLPTVHDLKLWYAGRVLDLTSGNRRRAARILGIDEKTLRLWITIAGSDGAASESMAERCAFLAVLASPRTSRSSRGFRDPENNE